MTFRRSGFGFAVRHLYPKKYKWKHNPELVAFSNKDMGNSILVSVLFPFRLLKLTPSSSMTEASPVTHISPNDNVKYGSIGPLVPNMDGMIVDPETGIEGDVGDTGEIWVRGPNVMLGYLGNPTATADTITKDGWLKTVSYKLNHFSN